MTRPGDPKGYYARLGVAVWATPQAIEIAFRARSRSFPTDPTPAPDAAERRQAIIEAHEALSDEVRRRAYDAEAQRAEDIAEGRIEAAPAPAAAAEGWFRRKPVLIGMVAATAVVLAVIAVIREPSTVTLAPARAFSPPPVPLPPRFERRVVNASGVNLRMGPGTEHAPASRIARGESVELLQPEADGWARVRLGDGRTGYIASRYLTAP